MLLYLPRRQSQCRWKVGKGEGVKKENEREMRSMRDARRGMLKVGFLSSAEDKDKENNNYLFHFTRSLPFY